MTGNPDRAYWAAMVAITGFTIWVLAMLVLHLQAPDHYDPVAQAISELAHERHGVFVDIAFFPLGIGGMAVALGLRWSLRGSLVASSLLGIAGVLWVVLGLFRTGPNGTGAVIHDAAAIASFFIMMGVMFLCAWQFRKDERWKQFAQPTLICASMAFLVFLLFPLLGEEGFGLAQRSYIAVWLIWLVAIAFRLRRLTSGEIQPA